MKLQNGVSKEEARKWLEEKWLPGFRNYPGYNAMLGEPIISRASATTNNNARENTDLVLVYYFDSEVAHDRYFTPTGLNGEIRKVIKEHKSTWDAFFRKYCIQDKYQKEEYLMFATAK